MFSPPPAHPPYLPPADDRPARRTPRPNHTWAWVYSAIGGVLVIGYFGLGSLVALVTLGGGASADQRMESDRLSMAAMIFVLLAPVGAWTTYLVVRWAEGRGQSGPALVTVIVTWLVSFAAAWELIDLFPSDDRPVAFGAIWAVGGMVGGPLVAAGIAYAGSRRSRNRRASK